MYLTPLQSSAVLLSVGWAYPHEPAFRFRIASVSGFPLLWLNIRIPCPDSGNRKGLASSYRFSPHMPRPWTPTAPRESNQIDSSVLASVALKTSPTAFMLISMLTWLQGCAHPLWPMWFSVYASHILHCSRWLQSQPPATLRRIRNTRYGWLVRPSEFSLLNSPARDFHPERSDKLRLPH